MGKATPHEYDEDRYNAEQAVKTAFMETPFAKRKTEQTLKAIKAQKAQLKKEVAMKLPAEGGGKKKRRGIRNYGA
jgi:hypothetical protein